MCDTVSTPVSSEYEALYTRTKNLAYTIVPRTLKKLHTGGWCTAAEAEQYNKEICKARVELDDINLNDVKQQRQLQNTLLGLRQSMQSRYSGFNEDPFMKVVAGLRSRMRAAKDRADCYHAVFACLDGVTPDDAEKRFQGVDGLHSDCKKGIESMVSSGTSRRLTELKKLVVRKRIEASAESDEVCKLKALKELDEIIATEKLEKLEVFEKLDEYEFDIRLVETMVEKIANECGGRAHLTMKEAQDNLVKDAYRRRARQTDIEPLVASGPCGYTPPECAVTAGPVQTRVRDLCPYNTAEIEDQCRLEFYRTICAFVDFVEVDWVEFEDAKLFIEQISYIQPEFEKACQNKGCACAFGCCIDTFRAICRDMQYRTEHLRQNPRYYP